MISQEKHSQSSFRSFLTAVSVLGIPLLILWLLTPVQCRYKHFSTKTQREMSETRARNYIRTFDDEPEDWFFKSSSNPTLAESNAIDAQFSETESILRKYAELSPLTKRISAYFTKLQVGFFSSRGITIRDKEAKPGVPNTALICFVSHEDRNNKRFISSRVWFPEWSAVMVYGKRWPPAAWAGVVFHELGHGLYDMADKAASSRTTHASKEWCKEEVDMHEVQYLVQNAATIGVFRKEIQNILTKIPESSSALAATCYLTGEDYRRLDATLGVTGGRSIRESTVADNIRAIGFAQIERKGLPRDREIELKIEFYRNLID